MNRRYSAIAAALVGGIVLGAASFALVSPSQAVSQSKSICVNKQTKELKLRKNCKDSESFFASASVLKRGGKSAYETWLEIGNIGTKQDFIQSLIGPRGASGASSSSGSDFLRNCFQKREAALTAGTRFAHRTDRRAFERASGCIVEEIKDETFIQIQTSAGIPVITDWQLIDYDATANAGEGIFVWPTYAGFLATYEIEIANYDAISEGGGNYGFCIGSKSVQPVQISGAQFLVTVPLHSSDSQLVAPMELGIRSPGQRGCMVVASGYPSAYKPFVIHEDPENFSGAIVWDVWGW